GRPFAEFDPELLEAGHDGPGVFVAGLQRTGQVDDVHLPDAGRSELAGQLASAGVRQVDIVDLTRALEAGHEDAGTIVAGLEQLGIELGERAAGPGGGSVMELLSDYLTATAGDDAGAIRSAMGSAGEEMRAAQVLAVADYLALETDLERAGEALGIWSAELSRAVADRDDREVHALLQPVRETLTGGGEERPALFDSYVRKALTREAVHRALAGEVEDGHPHLAAVLAPFGRHGVEILLDLLADEADRQRRALLLGALRRIASSHPDAVAARLRDERWFVVRNAVSILGSAPNATVLSRLAEVASHPAPEVRREVPEAMANAGGAEAAPFLRRLAIDGPADVRTSALNSLATLVGPEASAGLAEVVRVSPDRGQRSRALESLSRRPDGAEALRSLLQGEEGPRLSWRWRRQVRRLLSTRSS
ncbi:MAG TPA: HEAT repeat domain-containing protein, partial [Actinomycetota bacterium]|nr:HEAT repeat domain-containing protein [Actinomycetota bacterium]